MIVEVAHISPHFYLPILRFFGNFKLKNDDKMSLVLKEGSHFLEPNQHPIAARLFRG